MKKSLENNDFKLLRFQEIDVELGCDIPTRFSTPHKKGDKSSGAQKARNIIWTGLNQFGLAFGGKDGKAARERFVTMISGTDRERIAELRHYLKTVRRILISELPPRLLPTPPPELSPLDGVSIASLARAWCIMSHTTFFRALRAFAKRWTDFDAENNLILQALESIGETGDRNVAVAEWLADKKVLTLPPRDGKSQSGLRKRKSWNDIARDDPLKRRSRAVRQAVIERIRKRIERLTEPARIEKLRAKFGIWKPGAQLGSFLGEPNQPDEFTSLEFANYLVKYVEENLINNSNASEPKQTVYGGNSQKESAQ